MYGEFLEFVPLNEEEILKRVSQDEIIEMAIGYKPVSYQKMVSPLPSRKLDKSPGAYFEWFNGKLWFVDFADQPSHRVVLRFIRDFYNVTFLDALKIVNQHFNLGLGDLSKVAIPKTVLYETPKVPSLEKERASIIYQPRPFGSKIDATYWSKYFIHKNHLIEDEVMAAVWYKVFSPKTKQWTVIRPRDPMYIFTEFKERVKIYRPLCKIKAAKWCSNCDENDIGNYKNLPEKGKRLIIKKSYKDHRIVRNLGLDTTIWLQNEGCVPKEQTIIRLVRDFNEIVIFFDNDTSGIMQAKKLTNIFNEYFPDKTRALWLPEELNSKGIKDPGDWVEKTGTTKHLQEFLKKQGLYGTNT